MESVRLKVKYEVHKKIIIAIMAMVNLDVEMRIRMWTSDVMDASVKMRINDHVGDGIYHAFN